MTETSNGDTLDIDDLEANRERAKNIAIVLHPDFKNSIVRNSVNWNAEYIDRILNPPQWHNCMG